MEIYVSTLISDPPIQRRNVHEIIDKKTNENVKELSDSKLRTALKMSRDNQGEEGAWNKCVLESKAIEEPNNVSYAKQYRQWNRNSSMH